MVQMVQIQMCDGKVPISSHFPVFLMVQSAFFTTFGSKISWQSNLRNRRNQRMACRRTSAASMKVIGAAKDGVFRTIGLGMNLGKL